MNVLMTGGGTGGHVYPLVAIAEELKRAHPKIKLGYVGRSGGGECDIFKRIGIPVYTLPVRGIERKLTKESIGAIRKALEARGAAREIIARFKPMLVIGTGGYVCWPLMSAANAAGVPTVIHEANATAGLAAKLLARRAALVLLGQREVCGLRSGVYVGNPVRHAFFEQNRDNARRSLGIPEGAFFIISHGGSGGALKLNEVMPEVMNKITTEYKDIYFIHATGEKYYVDVRDRYKHLENEKHGAKITPYISDMPRMLAAADLAICRCGAMTLSELAATGTPALLIPSPNVTADHQRKNAELYATAGAATVLDENDLNAERAEKEILRIRNDGALATKMREKMRALAIEDCAKRITEMLEKRFFTR